MINIHRSRMELQRKNNCKKILLKPNCPCWLGCRCDVLRLETSFLYTKVNEIVIAKYLKKTIN